MRKNKNRHSAAAKLAERGTSLTCEAPVRQAQGGESRFAEICLFHKNETKWRMERIRPVHGVYVGAFCLAETPVSYTNDALTAVCKTGCHQVTYDEL